MLEDKDIIIHIGAEVAPFSKVGGLGDVIGTLPREMARYNANVKNIVITPYYSGINYPLKQNKTYILKFNGIDYTYTIYEYKMEEVTYIFIKADDIFSFDDCYIDGSKPYLTDVGLEYLFFGKCCCDYINGLNGNITAILTHDWHAAGIYPYLDDTVQTIHIIHNYQHQGQLYPDILQYFENELKEKAVKIIEDTSMLTMSSFAIYYANRIVTVSKNYAHELESGKVAHPGLELFKILGKQVIGIINGIDRNRWNPERENNYGVIPYNYETIERKGKNKEILRKYLNFTTEESRPILLLLSRLTQQKGLDLFVNLGNRMPFDSDKRMEDIINLGFDIIICGTPGGGYSGEIERQLQQLALRYKKNFRYLNKYSDDLAHLLLAGSDILLHPSNYEPCGLTPMYAMKYGTVPVVSGVGGLKDIVTDVLQHPEKGNGFVVNRVSFTALMDILSITLYKYNDKLTWNGICKNCMNMDFSWESSVKEYMSLLV